MEIKIACLILGVASTVNVFEFFRQWKKKDYIGSAVSLLFLLLCAWHFWRLP